MPVSSPARRIAAATAIVAALPLPVVVLWTTMSGRLALATCLVLPLAVFAGDPSLWPDWRRVGSLILVGPAVTTLVVGGIAFLFFSIGLLGGSDQSHDYLSTVGACAAVGGFLLPYALGSAWAVGRAPRIIWAWPLVILWSIVIGSGALLLLEGGVHHCET